MEFWQAMSCPLIWETGVSVLSYRRDEPVADFTSVE